MRIIPFLLVYVFLSCLNLQACDYKEDVKNLCKCLKYARSLIKKNNDLTKDEVIAITFSVQSYHKIINSACIQCRTYATKRALPCIERINEYFGVD